MDGTLAHTRTQPRLLRCTLEEAMRSCSINEQTMALLLCMPVGYVPSLALLRRYLSRASGTSHLLPRAFVLFSLLFLEFVLVLSQIIYLLDYNMQGSMARGTCLL